MEPERCARCGKCLPHCPAFQASRQETFSPRGKVALYQAGQLRGKPLSFCLLCGACETVCPNRVPVTGLILKAREENPVPGSRFFSHLWELLPSTRPRFSKRTNLPAKGKVALFTGCGGEWLYPEALEKLSAFLKRKGIDLFWPQGQGCCGLLALSLGQKSSFLHRAQQNLRSLASAEVVLTPCASCLYTLKVLYPRYLTGSNLEGIARGISEKTFEAGTFLYFQGFVPRIADFLFQVPCHLRYISKSKWWHQSGLKVYEGCCGGGGMFGVRYPQESRLIQRRMELLLEKHRIRELVTSCTGCWLTLRNFHRLQVRMLCEALIVAYC